MYLDGALTMPAPDSTCMWPPGIRYNTLQEEAVGCSHATQFNALKLVQYAVVGICDRQQRPDRAMVITQPTAGT